MVSRMEDNGAHQSCHEVSTVMPTKIDIGLSSVFCSPEVSSVHKPTPQEVATRLQGYVQRLQDRRALVKIPPEPGPTLAPMPTVPHAEAMVQALLGTQPGPALPRLEKMQIQQDLAATRVLLGSGHFLLPVLQDKTICRGQEGYDWGKQVARGSSAGLQAGFLEKGELELGF